MKVPIRIGIAPGTRALRIERNDTSWALWISANHDFTLGTYLLMHDSGLMENCTVYEDGRVESFVVKGKDR